MHSSRRTTGLTPLAIVLPHPPLPHRRSSLLSISSAASPHTPRSCPSPSLPIFYPANRNSTDSWNSSNADDMDVEWKQEHVLLLSRTLDALPAHLVTPFNGPVPPSNLLDKIARGVSQAKGPADWPYSIRATRVKLLELARTRAKEEAVAVADQRRHAHSIAEEDVDVEINDADADDDDESSPYSYYHNGEEKPLGSSVPIHPRRPLYRQSSMDFIKPGTADLRDNPAIARLSSRLQRTDRIITNPSYHPYSRVSRPGPHSHSHSHSLSQANRRSSSPPHSADVPALINPSSTPSSTTLDSFSSLESAPRILRRSASTLSSGSLFSTSNSNSNSNSSGGGGAGMQQQLLPDPRIQRVRRSDSLSFCSASSGYGSQYGSGLPPIPPPKDTTYTPVMQNRTGAGFKRAPSYGALAQEARMEAKQEATAHARKLSGSYPSSDEEEKARTTRAKKIRTRNASGGSGVSVGVGNGVGNGPPSPCVSVPGASPPPSSVPSLPSSPVVVKTRTGTTTTTPKTKSKTKTKDKAGATATTTATAKEGVMLGNANPNAGVVNVLKAPASVNTAVEGVIKTKTGKTDKDKEKDINVTTKSDGHEIGKDKEMPTLTTATKRRKPPGAIPMNPQRNPSMFGVELVSSSMASSSVEAKAGVAPAEIGTVNLNLKEREKDRERTSKNKSTNKGSKGSTTATTTREGLVPAPASAHPTASSMTTTTTTTYVRSTTTTKMRSPSPSPSLSPPPTRTHAHVLGTSTRRNLRGSENGTGTSQMQVRTRAAPLSPSLADALMSDSVLMASPTSMSMSTSTCIPTAPSSPDPNYTHTHMARSPGPGHKSPTLMSSALSSPSSPTSPLSPSSPSQPKVRALRRVRRILAPARRISFGSLVVPVAEEDRYMDVERDGVCGGKVGLGLGSAFQLH